MTLWVTFAVMSLVAIGFVAWPMYRSHRRLTPLLGITILAVVALSAGLYYKQGEPDLPSGAAATPEAQHIDDDAIAALAERLRRNPGDVDGWLMLGRSYSVVGNSDAANDAFEKALQVSPDHPQALFYGGVAASNRNDLPLAATRWERLLTMNPPAEIQDLLRERVAEWRGRPLPATEQQAAAPAEPPEGTVVSIELSLSEAAQAAAGSGVGVFVIARDPAQPTPPIAVMRLLSTELPAVVHLGDGQSMMAGRELSGFAEFEVVARAAVSGQRTQQSGDWYGSVIARPDENSTVSLTISNQVP